MDSFVAKSVSSTLHGATLQTAEGNEFINTGRDTVKIIQVIQNFIGAPELEQTSGNIVEDNEDLQRVSAPDSEQTSGRNTVEDNQHLQPVSVPVGNFDIYSTISTVLATIFGRRHIQPPLIVRDTTCPDESNLLPQEAINDRALIHCLEPAATVSDILAPDDFPFSSLPNTDTGKYTRSMLNCQRTAGYPLYEPRPDCDPSTEYWKQGVRIGDVGIVTEDGIFDFIFNVCPSQNPFINPSELPDDFETLEHPEIRAIEQHFKMETHLFNNTVNRIEEPDVRYKCSGSEGAILELPSGATLFEAKNKRSFRALASRHAEDWYKYTIVTRGRDVPNGSLYLVTSCVKCTDWGIAVFDRPSASQDYLQFIEHEFQTTTRNLHSKYDWKGSGSFAAKVAMDSYIPDSRDGDGSNQCIFVRGYKIMLRKDVWDNAIDPHSTVTLYITTPSSPNSGSKQTRQSDFSNQNDHLRREDGGGSESAGGTSRRPAQNTSATSPRLGAERVIIQADFNASPLNPSDLVNAALLSQEPNAKVALTHDDDWWDLLRDHEDLGKVASSYTSVIDEYGSASLEIVGGRSDSDYISSTLATRGQGISSIQHQSCDQQHLQPPNRNPSADMFSSPTMQTDAVRRPSPSHPPMPSQHMQNSMMTSAAQQNNTHTQPVPQTSMSFSSRPLPEQAMYLRNMIQSLNNNIAAHGSSPQDVDPMTKARVAVTYMTRRDAAAKMLNNVLAQMQVRSGGGQPLMQQQQQRPLQPVSMPRNGLGIQSSQPQAQHQPGNTNLLVHLTQAGQVGSQSSLTLQSNSPSVQGSHVNVAGSSFPSQPIVPPNAGSFNVPFATRGQGSSSMQQRTQTLMPSQHMQNGMMTSAAQQNNTHTQPVPQTSMSFSSRPLPEQAMYLRNMIQSLNNNIAAYRASPQDVDLMTKAQVTVTCMTRRDAAAKMLNNVLAQMQAQRGGEQGQIPWMQQQQQQQIQSGPKNFALDSSQIQPPQSLKPPHQQPTPNPSPVPTSGGAPLSSWSLQPPRQQPTPPYRPFNTRNSFALHTSQIRPPGESSLQPLHQQPTPNPSPVPTSGGALLPSSSLQPPQQQPTPPYRPFNARNSFALDTSQIRPPGASNPLPPSSSLQPLRQQPTPNPSPVPGHASAPPSSKPLNTDTPTLALPSPPSPRSPKGKTSAKGTRTVPPPVPAESPAATAASSSTPNVKRPREEDDTVVDPDSIGNNPGVANEPSPPKRIKTEWEIPQSEELKKKATEVKTESVEDTSAFFEQMSELLKKTTDNEGQESAWYADLSETIGTILKGCPEMSDNGLFGEAITGRESSPSAGLKDAFDEFIDYSFGQSDGQLDHEEGSKSQPPDLVSSSSTNLSPESNTDGKNSKLFTMSDIRKDVPHRKEVNGGESASYQPFEWK